MDYWAETRELEWWIGGLAHKSPRHHSITPLLRQSFTPLRYHSINAASRLGFGKNRLFFAGRISFHGSSYEPDSSPDHDGV